MDLCFKCKKPYFAGLRDCRGGPADNDQNQNNANKDFDPTHLICGGCVDLSGVAGETNCKKHGKVFNLFNFRNLLYISVSFVAIFRVGFAGVNYIY